MAKRKKARQVNQPCLTPDCHKSRCQTAACAADQLRLTLKQLCESGDSQACSSARILENAGLSKPLENS